MGPVPVGSGDMVPSTTTCLSSENTSNMDTVTSPASALGTSSVYVKTVSVKTVSVHAANAMSNQTLFA